MRHQLDTCLHDRAKRIMPLHDSNSGSISVAVKQKYWRSLCACCRPDIPLERSLVLEIDVASFTSSSPAQDEVPLSHQRKFLGLLDRCSTSADHQLTE